MIISFILGLIGCITHIGLKLFKSLSMHYSNSIGEYLKKNLNRIGISLLSYVAIYVLWFMSIRYPNVMPQEIKQFIINLGIKNDIIWFGIGYSADSIIRNLWNMMVEYIKKYEDKVTG